MEVLEKFGSHDTAPSMGMRRFVGCGFLALLLAGRPGTFFLLLGRLGVFFSAVEARCRA